MSRWVIIYGRSVCRLLSKQISGEDQKKQMKYYYYMFVTSSQLDSFSGFLVWNSVCLSRFELRVELVENSSKKVKIR